MALQGKTLNEKLERALRRLMGAGCRIRELDSGSGILSIAVPAKGMGIKAWDAADFLIHRRCRIRTAGGNCFPVAQVAWSGPRRRTRPSRDGDLRPEIRTLIHTMIHNFRRSHIA